MEVLQDQRFPFFVEKFPENPAGGWRVGDGTYTQADAGAAV